MSAKDFECNAEYRRYKQEQKIEQIKEIICSASISFLLGSWLTILILINI